jgi:superfamily I DNA and/or RNA helicase
VNFHEVDEIKDQLDRIIDYIRTDRHQSKKAKSWTIMIISFYEAQRRAIRDRLRRYSGMSTSESRFEKDGVKIFNYTVDMVQGREADFVLMSLSRTSRIGFMDCPNRINVAITRARYQLVIVGKADFFLGRSSCPEWRAIAGRGMESR